MSLVHTYFPKLRSWILSSITLAILPNNRQFGDVIHELLNSFFKRKLKISMTEENSFFICLQFMSFLGVRSWILSSMTPPIVPKNRYFGAVIHELLIFFLEEELKNLMKKTPSSYVFSS